MIPGQAKVSRPPTVVDEISSDGSIPNTGPEKVPGVFALNDLVVSRSRWTREMYVTRLDQPDVVGATPTCGCGGEVAYPLSDLMHYYHYLHGLP